MKSYEVKRVFVEFRPLSELTLRLPLDVDLRLGTFIIGGGALNQGLAVVAVVTDHSPFLAGAVVAGDRGL